MKVKSRRETTNPLRRIYGSDWYHGEVLAHVECCFSNSPVNRSSNLGLRLTRRRL